MEEFLVERKPVLHVLLVATALLEPGDEDAGVLRALEHILPHQLHQRTYLLETHAILIIIIAHDWSTIQKNTIILDDIVLSNYYC